VLVYSRLERVFTPEGSTFNPLIPCNIRIVPSTSRYNHIKEMIGTVVFDTTNSFSKDNTPSHPAVDAFAASWSHWRRWFGERLVSPAVRASAQLIQESLVRASSQAF